MILALSGDKVGLVAPVVVKGDIWGASGNRRAFISVARSAWTVISFCQVV
ncbi:MAG: hypothetical protein UT84_C0005G0028 [Candidatus Curtissbacteria bacterium GW2011_GWA1_40_16]|uniref:Uncharacterized protein n=1 Tax=Candidatus Curtissbacteria bacterium GW2011_GWA1_40_16 TaxID=1618405 RepID=A0A0G0UKX1_9BACT|nr:MAG: hypothetical protein UT84_C0005G0028 [Candidatus Curtissbacteria bacterium GW2011_GWA1_40_16]